VFSSKVEPFVFEDRETYADKYVKTHGISNDSELAMLNFHTLCKGIGFQVIHYFVDTL